MYASEEFDDKGMAVTGGGNGFGKAVALVFAELGGSQILLKTIQKHRQHLHAHVVERIAEKIDSKLAHELL